MTGKSSKIHAGIRNALKHFSQCHPDHEIDPSMYQSIVKRIESNLVGQLRVARGFMKTLKSDNLFMLMSSIEEELQKRGISTNNRVSQLEDAIRKHRDQRGDDRCWMDDQELYSILPEGLCGADLRLCEPAVMLENCKKYIASRHDPSMVYISSQRRIEELETKVQFLKG
jgi:hypothetical protein